MYVKNLLRSLKANVDPELYEDIKELIERLEKGKENYLKQLLNTRHELIEKDYIVENQKHALDTTKVTLEGYERENKALKMLVKEWASTWI